MKKIYASAALVLLLAGCAKELPSSAPAGNDKEVADLRVPAPFDWKMTSPAVCDIVAPHASRVYVSLEPGGEPFAVFMAGGAAEKVSLDVPRAVSTLYLSCETDTGRSASEAVSLQGGVVNYTVAAAAKNYAGIEDGDKNSTRGNVIYMPANGWGTLLFEDLWPAYGDYDFNDLVANYKVQLYMQNKNQVEAMLIAVRVKAVGGSLPYDLQVRMLGVRGGEIEAIEPYEYGFANASPEATLEALNATDNERDPAVLAFRQVRSNANKPAGAKYLNTERGYEMADDELTSVAFMVYFRNAVSIENVAFDTFDFYLADGAGKEIHLGGYKPTEAGAALYDQLREGNVNIGQATRFYYSNDNLVWGLNVPKEIAHAYESEDFLAAYPDFCRWAESGGESAQDWYEHGEFANLVRGK